MKKSYLLLLAFSACGLLGKPSFAQDEYSQCKPVEFGELQTFSKAELEVLYCKNKKTENYAISMQTARSQYSKEMMELGLKAAQAGDARNSEDAVSRSKNYTKEGDQYRQDASACSAENDRVGRLLAKQKVTATLIKCE